VKVLAETEQVILVDEQDRQMGFMGKMEAHEKALLHRAFSIFIFNAKGEMLLQQRAYAKYHSGGLWTNACCSHPRPGETTDDAANRRLKEELGFVTPLEKVFDFTYTAPFDNGLTENEFDHVYVGYFDGEINLNADEVHHFEYRTLDEIAASLQSENDQYTAWFHIAFPKVFNWWTMRK
jgi:isopentenyl-diphosphate delta-isomerase